MASRETCIGGSKTTSATAHFKSSSPARHQPDAQLRLGCHRAVSWAPPYSWSTSTTLKTTSQSALTLPHSPTTQPYPPKLQRSLLFLTTLEYSRLLSTKCPVGARIGKCSSSQPNLRPLQFPTIVGTGQYPPLSSMELLSRSSPPSKYSLLILFLFFYFY